MPFADDVRAGLTAHPKTLPSKYFYDEVGSALFEAICALPEYYLTRAEAEILRTRSGEVFDAVKPARIVELGTGSAVKTRLLLDTALHMRAGLEFSSIDISTSALEASAKALTAEYPALTVRSYHGDYYDGLRQLPRDGAAPVLMLFLGSNIGNFDPPEAQRLLRAIRNVLDPADALLLGTDLKKDRAKLTAAYDDPLGVTAAFNLNVLARINRELQGDFNLSLFRHRAFYNESAGRVESHLESIADQTRHIGALDLDITFVAGETIHTESSYKFSLTDVDRLAQGAGFKRERSWTDGQDQFADNLLRVV